MSAMTYRWDDPYRTGFAGSYDPGTMYGLYFRAQQGDAAAKNHLAQAGFFDQYGNDIYGAGNNYQQAVANWAKGKGLSLYNGANPFQWNQDYAQPNNSQAFQNAWTNFWNTGQQGVTHSQAINGPAQGPPPQPTQPNLPVTATSRGLPGTPQYTGVQNPNAGKEYSVYTPKTGKYIAGMGLNDHLDTRGRFGWGIGAGDTTTGGVRMLTSYNGQQDLARWSYAQNQNESSWEHLDRMTQDLMKNFGMSKQDAADEALRQMYAVFTAQGGDWSKTGFGAVPGIGPAQGQQAGQAQQPAPGTGSGGPAAQQPTAQQPVTTPAVAPTQGLPDGYQGTNAGNTGSLTAAQRLVLSNDPNQAYRYMMQQLGVNPDAPGLLGKFLQQKFQPLLEARMAASGVGNNQNYMDTIDQVINSFGGGLFQKGGNFFGDLANVGNQAVQQGAGYLNNLQDQQQAMQYLQQLGQLQYAGSNPLIQQAMADQMKRSFNAYNDLSFNQEGAGKNISPFEEWLLGQPRYKGIFPGL